MRTLILGDIHVSNKDSKLREAQENCIRKIYDDVKPDEVIQLGDFLDFRKPSPEALLSAKRMIDHWSVNSDVYILRGNHCASTKADDGVTAMSLFDKPTTQEILPYSRNRRHKVKVITHTWFDHRTKRAFIPHYENEERIKEKLASVPTGYTVFGHFGYFGCLNSVGDHDFDININSFSNTTFLGHIHRHNQRKVKVNGTEEQVIILGTPYTTNFGESGNEHYYALMEDGEISIHKIDHGPRHLLLKNSEVPTNIDVINDANYHTLLRVVLDAGETQADLDLVKAHSVNIKYSPAFNEEVISNYKPNRDLFRLNDVVIEDYINSANALIEKDKLMEGYNLLKYED
jgi:DNA repair exonuclease SbcCD nuclease subunit|tara:strand:+ start:4688 stop:5722 length:1035 start_codon:yes stop_codon:yes gene_type:complete